MAEHILFDLDGTLTDPFEGITNSVCHALVQMGIDPPPCSTLTHFIGPPLGESFVATFGMTPDEAETAVLHFRDYFRSEGILQNTLLPGVPQLLEMLAQNGKTMHLATSKPLVFAKQILTTFGISEYFTQLGGSPLDTHGSEKEEVVRDVLAQGGIHPTNAVMVGDRKYDVLGAAACGVPCIGVLVGYGSREELEEAGAVAIARDMDELGRLLLA